MAASARGPLRERGAGNSASARTENRVGRGSLWAPLVRSTVRLGDSRLPRPASRRGGATAKAPGDGAAGVCSRRSPRGRSAQLARLGSPLEVREKGSHGDLVTAVDRDCERLIVDRIRRRVSRERDPRRRRRRQRRGGDGRWLVDPLDGTTNYAHGYPLFCVSLAYERAAYRRGRRRVRARDRRTVRRRTFAGAPPATVAHRGLAKVARLRMRWSAPVSIRRTTSATERNSPRSRAARRPCGATDRQHSISCFCGQRPVRRILGVRAASVGRRRRRPDRARGRRYR